LVDVFADPIQQVASHCWCLVSKSFPDVIENIFDTEAVAEVVKGVEGLVNHLCPFFSSFADDVEKVDFGSGMEVLSQTSGHSCCYFEGPDDHIEVAVVDESANKLSDVSELCVGKLRN